MKTEVSSTRKRRWRRGWVPVWLGAGKWEKEKERKREREKEK